MDWPTVGWARPGPTGSNLGGRLSMGIADGYNYSTLAGILGSQFCNWSSRSKDGSHELSLVHTKSMAFE